MLTAHDGTIVPLRQVTQSVLYDPDLEAAGIFGNCLQAALASALGRELGSVPNFAAFEWWDVAARLWLRGKGFDWEFRAPLPDAGRAILLGQTRRGRRHAVVADDGQITWDPHPSRDGLTSVDAAYLITAWPDPLRDDRECILCRSVLTGGGHASV